MSDKKLLPFNPKRVVSKIVKNALDSSGTFAFTEHIEFNVGRIVCERIYYYYDGTEGDLSVVKSDLFNNNDVGILKDGLDYSESGCEIVFNEPKKIRGTYRMNVYLGTGSSLDTTRSGDIYIFLKYYEF